jgi:hypothetical protein
MCSGIDFPRDLVLHFTLVAAGLLAVSVGVFAFVPVIIELALQRSPDAERAYRQARRADTAFDYVLGSVVLLGASVMLGILSTYEQWYVTYIGQVVLLGVGIVVLVAGTFVLGITLRSVRRGG